MVSWDCNKHADANTSLDYLGIIFSVLYQFNTHMVNSKFVILQFFLQLTLQGISIVILLTQTIYLHHVIVRG